MTGDMRIGLLLLWLFLPLPGWATTILVLGDSLSAGYGIAVEQGWVALLEDRLKKEHKPATVVNASISGETSAGARRRLAQLLRAHHPDIVIIELGGNDGLRGLAPARTEANLAAMIEMALQNQAKVLLLGMKLPRNYGPRFRERFEAVYRRLSRRYPVAFVPFFLDEVALDDRLMQADGIHPRAAAQPRLLERVWPVLKTMLD